MKLEKLDIVLIDFPFSDLSETKKRPALVIKTLEGENNILCQITTKRRNFHKYEVALSKTSCAGDIKFDSFVYLDMIFTLHESLIHRKIGNLSDARVTEEINRMLREIFAK